MKYCPQCGTELKLDKIFKGSAGGMSKRERWKCTDQSCNHEETIQPSNKERHEREDRSLWQEQREENKRLSKYIEE
jgi:transposase-like protein